MTQHMSSADSNGCIVETGFGTYGQNAAGRLCFDAGLLTDAWQHERCKHSAQALFDTGPLIVAWQHEESKHSVQLRSLTGADLQQYGRFLGLHCTQPAFLCVFESQQACPHMLSAC